jgi:hypothetical protein
MPIGFDWHPIASAFMTSFHSVTIWRLLCAAIIWSASGIVAQASIDVPECPSCVLELDAGSGAAAGPSERSTSPNAPQKDPQRDNLEFLRAIGVFAHTGSASGTSANSVGSGGTSHTFAVRAVDAVVADDSLFTGWLSGEFRFAIPMPPVNSLLRPPQASHV